AVLRPAPPYAAKPIARVPAGIASVLEVLAPAFALNVPMTFSCWVVSCCRRWPGSAGSCWSVQVSTHCETGTGGPGIAGVTTCSWARAWLRPGPSGTTALTVQGAIVLPASEIRTYELV